MVYEPRLSVPSQRKAGITIYFPGDGDYIVSVNGHQHYVSGRQMDLSTSITSNTGTVVTLDVCGKQSAASRLVRAMSVAKSPGESPAGYQQLSLLQVRVLGGVLPSESLSLPTRQQQVRLLAGQHLHFQVQ
jgi:hypothetical protein